MSYTGDSWAVMSNLKSADWKVTREKFICSVLQKNGKKEEKIKEEISLSFPFPLSSLGVESDFRNT